MNRFIEIFDVEYNQKKKINVDHIVAYFPNNSGTGHGQLLLSTGKQINTAETPETLDDKIAKTEAVEILPCISGPSPEEIAKSMSDSLARTLPNIIKNLEEKTPRKDKKGKEKENSSSAPDYRDV